MESFFRFGTFITGIIYMTYVHQFVVAPQSNNSQDVAFSEVKYIVPFIVIYYSRLVPYLFQTYFRICSGLDAGSANTRTDR